VGLEALCIAWKGRQTSEGKAQLETEFLQFRGSFRLKIPLADIQRVQAVSGQLTLSTTEGVVTLDLGAVAAKWADKILHPPTRADKLGIKSGVHVVILGMSDKAFLDEVAVRTDAVSVRLSKDADLVFLAVERRNELSKLDRVRGALKCNGAIWIVYPKGVKTITESEVLRAGRDAGLVDVKVARFSATHTAHKFVIPVSQRRPSSGH